MTILLNLVKLVDTKRVSVGREIINVYKVFEIQDHTINCYKEPVTHIYFAPGTRHYPAGALTAPLRPPAGFDIPTFKGSSASTVSPSSDCRRAVATSNSKTAA